MSRQRVFIFLSSTFLITWGCWWILAGLISGGFTTITSPAGMTLFIFGGSGPTIGAYISVITTPREGSLREFHARVLKVRVKAKFYLIAVMTPLLLGLASIMIVLPLDPGYLERNPVQPIYLILPVFLSSVLMGGLEEFGWRGVLQECLQGALGHGAVNMIIGITWSLWHLPLFYIMGTSHLGNSFLLYAAAAVGYSGLLTWLYHRTGSIFLCVLFHASINTAGGIGASIPLHEQELIPIQTFLIFAAGLAAVYGLRKSFHRSSAYSAHSD